MARPDFDVCIAGGGMVGAATALALADHGLRIAVVEPRGGARWQQDVMDERVSSITIASWRLLVRLGAWDFIQARRASPFEAIHTWDDDGAVRFRAADIGEPRLGWIIENSLLQTALLEQLQLRDDVEMLAGAAIAGWTREADGLRVRLSDGRRLVSRLLVAADGGRSAVREQAGIEVREHAYGQQGIVATVTTEQGHGGIARQRFLASGPLALLPLADGRTSLVWSADDGTARALLAMGDAAFAEALADGSERVLGAVLSVTPRLAFPLQSRLAQRYIGERIALVGDAAHVIHPLAGQGVNLGLLDAAALAETVCRGVAGAGRRDPGRASVLRRYERWRRGDNRRMQFAMDGFHWLFANDDPIRRRARNLGFQLTDHCPPAKAYFMRHAMGLRGELPALMREPVSAEC
jgi:2-polyprenylphenol 6-hydroxylase